MRLVTRAVLKSERGSVSSLVSKETAQDAALSELIEKLFDNSSQELLAALIRLNMTKTSTLQLNELENEQRARSEA